MNPKEKDELRELRENLIFANRAGRYPYPLSKRFVKLVLKSIDHYEKAT